MKLKHILRYLAIPSDKSVDCDKGQHFVGDNVTKYRVWCEVCSKQATINRKGWTFSK